MIPVLAIPHLNRPDLLRRLVESVDYPVRDFVVIQNGHDKDCEIEFVEKIMQKIPHERFWHVKTPNLGVAMSWDYVIHAFSAPYWMFIGNDMLLAGGDLAKMHMAWEQHKNEFGLYFGGHGHSFFIHTADAVEKAGVYDPSFFPAYCEDCDMSRRFHLCGLRHFDVPDIHAQHGGVGMPGSSTIHSDVKLRDQNHRTHGNNFAFYKEKHGGLPGQEVFDHPFNNPHLPWDYVPFKPSRRDLNLWTY